MAFGAAATKAAVALAFALSAAMSAQAAHEWSGATDNKFSTSGNWGGTKKFNFVFNNTSTSRTLIYLDKNYSGKFKFGSETSTTYHQLIFRAHPANKPWHFCGWYSNAIHSYDNSGSETDCKIVVGDIADTYLRLSAITLKTATIQVGATGYSGHVIMDEYDADGTTYRGPVTFWTTGTMEFNKGSLHATNAVLTCDGEMRLYNFDATISGGTLNANKIYVGYGSNTSGSLTIEGATVTATAEAAVYVCYGSGATGTLYLNEGGTLVARNIYKQNGTASVVFNGGTLKAKSVYTNYGGLLGNAGSMTITVGEKGGTIDNNSLDIAISGNYMQGSGAVRFTGSGSTTLSVAQQYTGGTTIDAGTLLKVNGAAKAELVAHTVTVAIPAGGVADGTVVLETTDGTTFTQAEVDAMAFSGDDDNRYALELADGGAKVKIVDVRAGEYVWNGGASGDSWKTAGAWTKNGTAGNWYDLVAAVFENDGDAAAVDSAVAAESVAFRANATVTGTATLTVPSVVVSNGVSATISAPTADALEKTGEGTLTLGSARTATTTLSEGTLALTGSNQTTAWSNIALGNGNAVTLAIGGGATLTHSGGALYIANDAGQDVTMSIDGGGTVEVRNLFYGYGTGAVEFNGGTLKANQSYSAYGGLIGSGLAVSITGNGGTIDNGGYDILVSKDLAGAMSFTGSGTTTIGVNQSATGSMAVNGGTVALNAGLTVARPVTVAAGATLKATGVATLSGVEFADGATLDVTGSAAVAASATFPANGTVTLKKNGGAFARGLYPILAKTGITAAEVDGKLVPSLASGSSYGYCVKDDTLYLAVDVNMTHSVWTGEAGDGKMSTGGNWWSGTAPGEGDALDFSCITSGATIDCDIDAALGAVTMGSQLVTFTNDYMKAASFSDMSKVVVGANSTVTITEDYTQTPLSGREDLVYSIGAGGKLVFAGTFALGSGANEGVNPQTSVGGGVFVVNRIENNADGCWIYLMRDGYYQKWVVGPGGIGGTTATGGLWLYSNPAASAEFQANTNDFEVALPIVFRTGADYLTFNTTGWGDGEAHIITLSSGIYDNGAPLNISGTGTVVANFYGTANYGDGGYAPYSGDVTVSGTATLAINAGKRLTSGTITVNYGATLALPETGTVTLTGPLSLANGSALSFKLDANSETTLNMNGKTLTASESVNIKFAEGSVFAPDKAYTLISGANLAEGDEAKFALPQGNRGTLSVVEGNLVYLAPKYFIIKVK